MQTISLNAYWRFRKLPGLTLNRLPDALPDGAWEEVVLPHTWYRDDDPYQGLVVYERTIVPDAAWQRVFLSFDGADQRCLVYVNGHFAGEHRGGYARFRLPVPDAAMGDDVWRVQVFLENSVNENIAPSFGDFTVFGGLYRSVDLLVLSQSHFDRCYFGTDGLIVRTWLDDEGRGILDVEPHAVCADKSGRIAYALTDGDGRTVCRPEAGTGEAIRMTVDAPALWDGAGSARLYTLSADLVVDGAAVDHVAVRTGFRRVELSGENGLRLNGRPCQIRGVARHQDRAGAYCAATASDIREDFAIIREMGANGVRLSHYQHPQAAYDCCDELGLLCWAEIPMLKMTESPALMENAAQQLTELILQNIHHPSVFCWGIQNEIAMFRDAPFMHEGCKRLHALVKSLDGQRLSTAANLYPLKASSKLNEITDMIGYNLYFGWYYGEMADFGPWLDRFHAVRGQLPLGISEYGVDANLALHSEAPTVKDYSEEYQALWHETVYPQIAERPWLWGSFVWNMFDFSSTRRNEGGQRFINAKGLVTHDRKTRKDAFYYYKARWSEEPFVHLCARRFENRAQAQIDVKCYTNRPSVKLLVNGLPFGEARSENGTAVFKQVPLVMGDNAVQAVAGDCADSVLWHRVHAPDPGYRLPDEEAGGAVRNWFLAEDDMRREGFFSIQNTAQELLDNADARAVLEAHIPGLVRVMTEQSVIPLGLSLKSILSRDADEKLDIKALNGALNRIPDTDE